MKAILLSVILFYTQLVLSQQEKAVNNQDVKTLNTVCQLLSNTLLDKESSIDISTWYEGLNSTEIEKSLAQLKSEIIKSALEATYSILLLKKENPFFYSITFYAKDTLEQFGQLYVVFNDDKNKLVDKIKIITKDELEIIEAKNNQELLPSSLPLPPKPPKIKKKN